MADIDHIKKLKEIIGHQLKNIDPDGNAWGFNQGEAKLLLDEIDRYDLLFQGGNFFSHMYVIINDMRFLFYNVIYNIQELPPGDQRIVVLRKGNSPDVLEYQKGIIPLAFPTRCNIDQKYLTQSCNGNMICTMHGSTYWYCSQCGTWRSLANTTADGSCEGGRKCNAPCSPSPKCKGRAPPPPCP